MNSVVIYFLTIQTLNSGVIPSNKLLKIILGSDMMALFLCILPEGQAERPECDCARRVHQVERVQSQSRCLGRLAESRVALLWNRPHFHHWGAGA